MVSTFTANIQLEEPARGDDVGVWDTPVNSNMTVVDRVAGAITTIGLNNSPVVLASAQYQSKTLIFNSTLTGSVAITFPTSFTKSYEVLNACTGIQFTITLGTTAAGGQAIAVPPGDMIECYNDGANLKFKNLGRVGTYWDYGGSSVPNWVSGCTVPPYLNCDASAISSATYPVLFTIMGGTLPDSRGRYRAALNQATGRITTAGGGVDGNTILASGGLQTAALGTPNMPPYTPSGTVTTTISGGVLGGVVGGGVTAGGTQTIPFGAIAIAAASPFVGIAQGGVSTPFSILAPTYIGGLTLIRAA